MTSNSGYMLLWLHVNILLCAHEQQAVGNLVVKENQCGSFTANLDISLKNFVSQSYSIKMVSS